MPSCSCIHSVWSDDQMISDVCSRSLEFDGIDCRCWALTPQLVHRNWWVRGAGDPPRQFSWHRPSWLPLHQRWNERHGFHPGDPGGAPSLVQMYQPLGDGLVMVSPKIIPCLIVPQSWPNPVLFSLDIPGHPWTHPSLQWLLHRFNMFQPPIGFATMGQVPTRPVTCETKGDKWRFTQGKWPKLMTLVDFTEP